MWYGLAAVLGFVAGVLVTFFIAVAPPLSLLGSYTDGLKRG
jgi:hypothetical protein